MKQTNECLNKVPDIVMLKIKNDKLLLPVQLSIYAYENDLLKPLAVYLYLKFYSDGKIKKDSPIFQQLRKDLKLNSDKTFRKHINKLTDLNWLGYCAKSKVYWARGVKYVRFAHNFKKTQATVIIPNDLNQFQEYLVSVIISNIIRGQEFFWEVVKKRMPKEATYKWTVAKHSEVSSHSSKPAYCGLSNAKIAEILGCKMTRACVLKNQAVKAGYLQTQHKYADFISLEEADFNVRSLLYEQYPKLKGKLRCWRKWRGKKKYVKLVVQLHDEIIPCLKFKRIEKLTHINLPFEVIKGLKNSFKKAA